MADHPDAFGPDEPSPLPEAEFKSNFFENMGSEKAALPEPATLASLPPAPPEPARRRPMFPVVVGLGFVAIIVAGALISMKSGTPPAATATAPAPAPTPTATSASAPETTVKEADLKALDENLKSQVAALSKEVKALEERLAALPKPAPAPDLAPLDAKVEALSKSVDAVAPLSKKVDALDERVGGLDKSLKSLEDGESSLKEQVAALQTDLKKSGTAETTTRDSAKPVDANVEGQSFAQAVELFKAGKYKEASQLLKTTEENDPKDARVWYYAALSAGMSTNQWRGDTEKMVRKGVEREKAGTPSAAEINTEFAKLSPSLKAWLDGWRKLAQQ